MKRIDQITDAYNNALMSQTVVHGKSYEEAARIAFDEYRNDLINASESGLTKEECTILLETTICLKPEAFLIALSVCNDFEAFSTLLDTLEPEMAALETPEATDPPFQMKFFSEIMSTNAQELPDFQDFKLYKYMRAEMLKQSNCPDGDVIRSVIKQFENESSEESNEVYHECRIM